MAPAGIAVYRGSLFAEWDGDLLVPMLAGLSVHKVTHVDGRASTEQILLQELDSRIRDIKVSPRGELYVITDGAHGALLKIVPAK